MCSAHRPSAVFPLLFSLLFIVIFDHSFAALSPDMPNVCSYNVMSMVKVRKPCLRAYTKIERIRKPNCPYTDSWCTDYKPRTIYYTGYTHKLEPRYHTIYKCCSGCFPLDKKGCIYDECSGPATNFPACDEELPSTVTHCVCDVGRQGTRMGKYSLCNKSKK
ncbi:EGF-like and EMI domain-containing protein 1 [Stegodyphus dumicola]|uniref:EGF-like and EMI domain-containing protein 1 n=1 Tax=Stegodyphus dumicola TaxID=202533 RepID=UPI0015AE05C6|nr:EGF-like and EMI domain-containing protein 1 [Stegodyphus dumicola]